ncbi:uncharacterized protein BJ212DRAFT_1478087 [Suillus subaureus]|uniref:Uncharacterized protein n=1 Tax=Suillus subaureus TaxID=48587 RepID=A0A9P7EHC5_9AGAM|nr:uncharacterized protein BJ212DRAFT_1478087 [Suillus subaureus]KAG1820990.1 hypothetical protein BJ212DRAFT_1478087 [Suillus subaureus]
MPFVALPSPDALTVLVKLTSDPNNIAYIISSQDQAFLEEHLGHFLCLGMSMEHGRFIHSPDSTVWMNFTASLDMGWREEVAEIFRQCQDLLENNVVSKSPIKMLMSKKNLEVRPIAVNKGEIVKHILYQNPGVEFIFCAGDNKTNEDMFCALLLFSPSSIGKVTMEPPLLVMLIDDTAKEYSDVELMVSPEAVFMTAVGHSSK